MTAGNTGAHALRAATDGERRRRTRALRRRLAAQLLFELVLPLGSYYLLRAAGAGQWLALGVVLADTLLSLVTGDARVLLLDAVLLVVLIAFTNWYYTRHGLKL